jgi:hypothetical protein
MDNFGSWSDMSGILQSFFSTFAPAPAVVNYIDVAGGGGGGG